MSTYRDRLRGNKQTAAIKKMKTQNFSKIEEQFDFQNKKSEKFVLENQKHQIVHLGKKGRVSVQKMVLPQKLEEPKIVPEIPESQPIEKYSKDVTLKEFLLKQYLCPKEIKNENRAQKYSNWLVPEKEKIQRWVYDNQILKEVKQLDLEYEELVREVPQTQYFSYQKLLEIIGFLDFAQIQTFKKGTENFKNEILEKSTLIEFSFEERQNDSSQFLLQRQGSNTNSYKLKKIKDFHQALAENEIVIKNPVDLQNLILPIFALIHGEKYNSSDFNQTYYLYQSQNHFLQVKCRKCDTLQMQFTYDLNDENQPTNIKLDYGPMTKTQGIHHIQAHPNAVFKKTNEQNTILQDIGNLDKIIENIIGKKQKDKKSHKTGKWDFDEDIRLREAVKQYKGEDWPGWGVIADKVGTRTRRQARERYQCWNQPNQDSGEDVSAKIVNNITRAEEDGYSVYSDEQ